MNGRIWAVDVEGSGGKPPEIVELAIVEMLDLELSGASRSWRMRPPGGISPIASRIHGIWDRDVAGAPELDDVASDVLGWIEGCPIVGHNVRVEVEILGRSLEDWTPPAAYDTLRLARILLPDAPRHGLQALGESLALAARVEEETGGAAHSALYDATLCATLLRHLLDMVAPEERPDLLSRIDVMRREQGELL